MCKRILLLFALAIVASPAASEGATGVGSGGGTPGTASNFRLVGHDPLFSRGMNAALAIYSQAGAE